MCNKELLDKKITDSGYKTSFICDTLGLCYQSFREKRENKYAFSKSEIFVLRTLLNLSAEDVDCIFYAQKVE